MLRRIIGVLLVLAALDGTLQLIYRVKSGEFTWETIGKVEVFKVQYLQSVDDERYVIPDLEYRDDYIQFDQFGFRAGATTPSRTRKNIIFLGDSVPFGYGVKTEESIPNRVGARLRERGFDMSTVNAAVPSYSLNQSVYRYVYDIEGRFPVSVVVIQVYDPASNFYWFGADWDVTKNWYTTSAQLRSGEIKRRADNGLRYSFFYFVFWRYSGLYFRPAAHASYGDGDVNRYEDSIRLSLRTLLDHLNGSPVLLLPIVRPKDVMEHLSAEEKLPITKLNEIFRLFSTENPNVYYVDPSKAFNGYQDDEIFQDVCCHLTPKGLELESILIADTLAGVLSGEASHF